MLSLHLLLTGCLGTRVPAPHTAPRVAALAAEHPLLPTLPSLPALPALPSLPNTEGGVSLLPTKIMPPINAPAPLMDRGYSLTTSMLAATQYGESADDFLEPYAWTAMLSGMI